METKVSLVPIFFLVFVLGFFTGEGRRGADDGEGVAAALSPSPSVPCSAVLFNFNSSLIPFNASDLTCSYVWPSQGFVLMYEQSSPTVWSFVLTAPDNNAYIAIGSSPRGRMIGASAIAGWVSSSGSGTVKQYYLGGYKSRDCPPDQGNLTIVPGSTTIISQDSQLYLTFQLNTTEAPDPNVILAVGPPGRLPRPDNYLPKHRAMTAANVA